MNKNGVGGGHEIPVWEIRQGWRIGIIICLDMWVPEIPRIEVLKGADLIVVISAGPVGTEENWIHVNRIRAIENTTGFTYCNLAGDEHGFRFFGGRMAVEAGGEVLVPMEGSADKEGMAIATFSAEKLYNARKTVPALIRDRNPAAYQRLVDPERHMPDFIPYRGKKG